MYKLNDQVVQNLIESEYQRQNDELEMIASENYVSKEVMEAYSNIFTNKYSEGYPYKRYYGGQENVDKLEVLTQYRALRIFGLNERLEDESKEEKLNENISNSNWNVNVQPLSGSPANLAVYLGVLNPGDTILSMDLGAGGHLSHGHKFNSAGTYYNIVNYGVNKETGLIDYNEIEEKALENKPSLILAGYSSYPRDIDWENFSQIADKVEEKHGYRPILMADIAHIAGLIAGGVLNNPFDYFDIITTTTHKTLRGPRGALIYSKKGEYSRNNNNINFGKLINRGVFPGVQGGPHVHVIAAKCVAFGEVLSSQWQQYTKQVVNNSKVLAQELKNYGYKVFTNGTDNHIVLVDITTKNSDITGKIAESTLEKVGISLNKNLLPFDERPPMDPSGLRIGTAAVTSRGLKEEDIKEIAYIINEAIENVSSDSYLEELKERIKNLCYKFPLDY